MQNDDIQKAQAFAANGQHQQALMLYNEALKKEPQNNALILGMGQALLAMKNPQKARVCFEKALQADPTNAEILLGIAQAYKEEDPDKARQYFIYAFECDSASLASQNHLVISYYEAGKLEDLEGLLKEYIARNPDHFIIRYFLAEYYLHMRKWDALHLLTEETVAKENIYASDRARMGLVEFLGLYLTDHIAELPPYLSIINELNEGFKRHGNVYEHSVRFYNYLLALLQYAKDNPALYEGASDRTLHVVGESHSMSAARLHVSMSGKHYRCQPYMIQGAKAFNLKKGTIFKQRAYLEHCLHTLPPGSDILMMIGEIDCRADEGIVPYALKHKLSVADVASKTASDYMQHIMKIARERDHTVSFCNVPPLSAERIMRAQKNNGLELIQLVANAIAHFNAALAQACKKEGVKLVDIYRETVCKNDIAKPDAHLEGTHIRPHYVKQAIERAS